MPAFRTALLRALAFSLAVAAALPAVVRAVDVEVFALTKTHLLKQDAPPPAGVSSRPGDPYVFEAFVIGTGSSPIDSVLLTLPGGLAGSPVPGDGLTFFVKSAFATETAMENAYSAGLYRLEIDSLDDGYTPIQLTLPTSAYPADPRIVNFDEAQAVNPSAPFTIRWDPFTGAGPEDFIEVAIYDSFGFEVFVETGLNGTNLSVTLPANTLQPNATHDVELVFVNVDAIDPASYPGAIGYTAFRKSTLTPLLTSAGSTQPSDVSYYAVLKWERHLQTGAGDPVLEPVDPYQFSAIVHGKTDGSVTAASVASPSGSLVTLLPDPPEWSYDAVFASSNLLNQAFPSGLYSLSISAVTNGLRSPFLVLAGDTYPNPPKISNLDAAQAIPPGAPFALNWEPFAGGTDTDYIRLEILDGQSNQVVQTGNPGDATALPGTASSFLIPANTLQPGATYTGILLFADTTLELNGYPGAYGLSAYVRSTTFTIQASASGDTAPTLTGFAILPGTPSRIQFTVNGTAGRPHRIDASDTLGAWTPVSTNTPAGATFPFTADITPAPSHRFYRVVLLP